MEFVCKQCNLKNEKCLHRKICKKCHSLNTKLIAKTSDKSQEYINSDKYKQYKKDYQKNYISKLTKEERNSSSLKRNLKAISNLTDSYIKKRLKEDGFSNISNELIEVKRLIIKTKRLCKI
jgi:hypothetical protein